MKNAKPFEEVQRFNHPVLLGGLALLTLYTLSNWMNIFYDGQLSDKLRETYWVTFGVVVAVDILFLLIKLQTRIDEQGIWVKFYPFHFKFILYPWEGMRWMKVRKYNPIMEFGGWGLRFSTSGAKAFNTRGNKGIEFETHDGRKRVIGTQKPAEVLLAMEQFSTVDVDVNLE